MQGVLSAMSLCNISRRSFFHKISQYCSSALWPDSMGGSDPRTFRGVWQQMGKVGVCLRSVNTSVPEGISAESKISPQTPGILSGVSL